MIIRRLILPIATFVITFVVSSNLFAGQSIVPSTTVLPYLDTHLPGVEIKSILAVDDGTFAKTGGGTTRLVGIPDGIGMIDGNELSPAEPEHFYILLYHEINNVQGVVRDHGNAGSFVSK